MNNKGHFAHLFLCSVYLFLASCSVGPEKTTPGSCSLDCSKARIGGSEFEIKPFAALSTRGLTCVSSFANGMTEPLSVPQMFKFTVQRSMIKSTVDSDGKVTKKEESTPVAAVSVLPIISGGLDKNSTHVDNDVENNPAYSGIRTPKSEWCSDSCGTVSLEIMPLCIQKTENSITIVLQSGSANSEPATLTVTNPSE